MIKIKLVSILSLNYLKYITLCPIKKGPAKIPLDGERDFSNSLRLLIYRERVWWSFLTSDKKDQAKNLLKVSHNSSRIDFSKFWATVSSACGKSLIRQVTPLNSVKVSIYLLFLSNPQKIYWNNVWKEIPTYKKI